MPAKMSIDPFTVDIEAFREEQAGRAPAALIREGVQGGLDAAHSRVTVTVHPTTTPGEYEVHVVDDGPGFRDLRAAWTFFMSGKRDDPTKRGRMGRGLKELLSVSDWAEISTTCGTVRFARLKKGKWERSEHPRIKTTQGTSLKVRVRSLRWRKADVDAAVEHVRAFLPPPTIVVNGAANKPPLVEETFDMTLQTVVYEGEAERRRQRKTTVTLLDRPDGERWLYEMGVPVQKVEYPMSINVAQRIPLKAHRDVADPEWLRALYADLLSRTHDKLDRDDLTSTWATEAAQAPDRLTKAAKVALRDAYLPEGVMLANTVAEAKQAENFGKRAVLPSAVPAAVRGIVREVAPKASAFIETIRTAETSVVPFGELTPAEQRFVRTWERLIERAGYTRSLVMEDGRPTHRAQGNASTVRLFRQKLGTRFFANPLLADRLSLLVHELAHGKHTEHAHVHGDEFHSDVESVAGRIAAACAAHAEELRSIAAGGEA